MSTPADVWKYIEPALIGQKVCINDPSKRFSGMESSPRGRGYCPVCEGATMKGGDGKMWVAVRGTRGTLAWTPKAARSK